MAHLPQVQTLYAIADNVYLEPGLHSSESHRTNAPHDALSLVRLVQTSSLVAENPSSPQVTKFADYYRICQWWDLDIEKNHSQLNDRLWELMCLVDEIFFFNTITRVVQGPEGPRSLVSLRITEKDEKKRVAEYDMEDHFITLWLGGNRKGPWERYNFEHILHSLVHELCHAFLENFSDSSHPSHEMFVDINDGHGIQFWQLLKYVLENILKITGSREWEAECKKGEVECWNSISNIPPKSSGPSDHPPDSQGPSDLLDIPGPSAYDPRGPPDFRGPPSF
ncbi:hypothetical protein GGR58DRAFT_519170 [Xylaria digitata]|nr:hypothetical protein GGR58DRAFT_519170 [Xylaria digitata]